MTDATAQPEQPEITRQLIREAKDGNRAALDALVERIQPFTQATARRLWPRTRHDYSTEDIHQTVMARLVQGFDKFEGEEKAQLLNWFRVALTRRGIDLVRHANGSPVVVGLPADGVVEAAASEQASPATQLVRTDELARMRRALQHLDPMEREVIVEHDLKQVPLAELAQRFGISLEAVKKRVQRARDRLGELIRGASGPTG